MAIKPICMCCKKEFNEFGAILISPPYRDNKCNKDHLCVLCYDAIILKISTMFKILK